MSCENVIVSTVESALIDSSQSPSVIDNLFQHARTNQAATIASVTPVKLAYQTVEKPLFITTTT